MMKYQSCVCAQKRNVRPARGRGSMLTRTLLTVNSENFATAGSNPAHSSSYCHKANCQKGRFWHFTRRMKCRIFGHETARLCACRMYEGYPAHSVGSKDCEFKEKMKEAPQ